MMKYSVPFLSLIAAVPAVRAVAYRGPTPTVISPALALLEGTSPKPTIPPSNNELKKRQTNNSPESCGWIDALGVTCPGSRSCMIFTSGAIGMQGCCNGANTIDCGWATSCVDSVAFRSSECGSACQTNTFIRKCTAATAAYCDSWTFDSWSVTGYGCAAYADSVLSTIFDHATDAFGATTSMVLPTAAANILDIDTGGSTPKPAKKLAIGVIVGIVIVALFVLFCIAIGILFCIKKKRKNAQIAASAQAMAAVQATRPQSQFQPTQPQYPPPQQTSQYVSPQHQQAPMQTQTQQSSHFQPSIVPQNPPPTTSYFPSGVQTHEEKPTTHTSVHEYATTPVSPLTSSPSTPAPVYSQPHSVQPPMPMSVANQYQAPHTAPPEAHEVDAVSVPHVNGQVGNLHEIGSGK